MAMPAYVHLLHPAVDLSNEEWCNNVMSDRGRENKTRQGEQFLEVNATSTNSIASGGFHPAGALILRSERMIDAAHLSVTLRGTESEGLEDDTTYNHASTYVPKFQRGVMKMTSFALALFDQFQDISARGEIDNEERDEQHSLDQQQFLNLLVYLGVLAPLHSVMETTVRLRALSNLGEKVGTITRREATDIFKRRAQIETQDAVGKIRRSLNMNHNEMDKFQFETCIAAIIRLLEDQAAKAGEDNPFNSLPLARKPKSALPRDLRALTSHRSQDSHSSEPERRTRPKTSRPALPSQPRDCQAPRSQDGHSSMGTDSQRERERDLQKPSVPIPAAYRGGSGGGEGGQDGVSSARPAFVSASADANPPRKDDAHPPGKEEYSRPNGLGSRPNTTEEGGGSRRRKAPHERPKTAAVQARSFIKTSIGAFVRIAEGRAEPESSPFHKLVSHQFVTPHTPVPPATAAEPEKHVTSSQLSRLQTSRPPLYSQPRHGQGSRDALFPTGPRQQHQIQVARLRVGEVGKLLHVAPGSDTTAIQELAAAPLTALATMSVSDNKVLNQYGAVQVMLQARVLKSTLYSDLHSKYTIENTFYREHIQ
jgi:hypothetical protein